MTSRWTEAESMEAQMATEEASEAVAVAVAGGSR